MPDAHQGDLPNQCTLPRGADLPGPGPAPAPSAGQPVRSTQARVRPRGLSARVRHVGRRGFRVTGRLLLPSGVTAAQGCGSGVVAVRVKARTRTISARRVRLRAGCTYSSSVAFRHRRGRLRFIAQFFGNRAVTGVTARSRFARLR